MAYIILICSECGHEISRLWDDDITSDETATATCRDCLLKDKDKKSEE
jgi:DNA-directed RNA polymerase subunit RPC12/RpoP